MVNLRLDWSLFRVYLRLGNFRVLSRFYGLLRFMFMARNTSYYGEYV